MEIFLGGKIFSIQPMFKKQINCKNWFINKNSKNL